MNSARCHWVAPAFKCNLQPLVRHCGSLIQLSRSLSDLLNILTKLDQVGAGFKSLTESIDTTSNAGE
jgi:hypothetical protein